jgi:hypothetical protein
MKLLQLLSDEQASVRLRNNILTNCGHEITVLEFLNRWPTSHSRTRRNSYSAKKGWSGGLQGFGATMDGELTAILDRYPEITNPPPPPPPLPLKLLDPQPPVPWVD